MLSGINSEASLQMYAYNISKVAILIFFYLECLQTVTVMVQ